MESLPQLVAMLHSFVGLAAVFVGIGQYLAKLDQNAINNVMMVEIVIGVWIGAITFTGSILAWAKLEGRVSGRPLLIPGRHMLNLGMLIASVYFGVLFVQGAGALETGLMPILAITGIACVLGLHLVGAIGGADMPVVVSLLNSYSGWAAAAAGFMLGNDLLIVTGALVGSSGAILSYIMCKAMNRSIWNVVFGGFGASAGAKPAKQSTGEKQDVWTSSPEEVADSLRSAKEVMIIPGYGMAVAQAQHLTQELTSSLRKSGKNVRFAIHPVAGRLPGHMNVLLAEANVPYDIVFEMDEVNEEFGNIDLSLVVGANDIVNPGALTDESSPIYGMPVIEAWNSGKVVVLKRGLAAGYAGVDNPIYYNDNTMMLFGDAKDSIGALLSEMRK
jgi:NAD(P) transhydrogenase subunit beta